MDIAGIITKELGVKRGQIEAAIELIDSGNTIPFIARYRKEVTGSLNDEQLRLLEERLNYLRSVEDRKETVINSITEQGKMTDELLAKINAAEEMVVLEDLYRPYKPKKTTKAMVARERGLEPLAELIKSEEKTDDEIRAEAEKYVDEEKELPDAESAVKGALDIIAEDISDNADFRSFIRDLSLDESSLTSKAKDSEAQSVYEMYYDYEESFSKIANHNILAINRGEKEKILTVKVVMPDERCIGYLNKQVSKKGESELLQSAVKDAYDRLIAPSIERELRNYLTERAGDEAIKVFAQNLKQLLMQPPIAGKVVLGWDPAYRTGCKLAVVDETGKVLDTKVIFPTKPQEKIAESKKELEKLVDKYNISLISLGNGTASRESEQVIAEFIKEEKKDLNYVIVNEAGASVYSASKLATEEFPEFDVGQRSAASIARRLQDPLSELVKIDPKAIGVGQYQHDMDQKKLNNALENVVEDSVNKVGVDLNTASSALLKHVSGINNSVANNIVAYREENGSFKNRKELMKVPKLGAKTFEQSAGFMRISSGDNPLDATGIHPESYEYAIKLMDKLGLTLDEIRELSKKSNSETKKKVNKPKKKNKPVAKNNTAMAKLLNAAMQGNEPEAAEEETAETETQSVHGLLFKKAGNLNKLAEEIGVGVPTLEDILKELEKPARDPREDLPKPVLRHDVLDLDDLEVGMVLKGTVRNIVDFGAFVDIGVHEDGLVHISQITNRFIKHPLDVLSIGDVVEVKIIDIDKAKKRIGLSMKELENSKKTKNKN